MNAYLDPPLAARNGWTLKVLGIARISTEHQDRLSLSDQEALYRNWITEHTPLPFELKMIAGQGSGECIDRKEAVQAWAELETAKYDLVIAEDLARIFRRIHAQFFCEACEDVGTRLIAINDHVDTGREDWRLNAHFATMRHEMYNADTGKRIRRSLRNRFSQGGVFQCPIYGYVKPLGAKSDEDVRKDPAAESIYDRWFCMLENDASYSEVADWLNKTGIPVGPYCRAKRWTGAMVRRLTFNPILKGDRRRNDKVSKRINRTGRRKSVTAPPQERLTRFCSHLAFIEPARYDRLIRKLQVKSEKYARGRQTGRDSRKGVSKKRTYWPGQHLCCGICGRLYYWGGHGQQHHMMCSGNRDYRCWNGITFDGFKGAENLCNAILNEIEKLPDFDSVFLNKVQAKWNSQQSARAAELVKVSNELQTTFTQIDRVTEAIGQIGVSRALSEKLGTLEIDRDRLSERQEQLRQEQPQEIPLPPVEKIKRLAKELLAARATDRPEFRRCMMQLIPSLKVYPYRLCDGGHVVLRAKLVLNLAALVTNGSEWSELGGVLRRELTIDLFNPPQRQEFRERVMALRREGLSERNVAARLGLTITAVQRAAALQRMMDQQGLTDPYSPVTAPPEDHSRLRRHLHRRYRFEPLREDNIE